MEGEPLPARAGERHGHGMSIVMEPWGVRAALAPKRAVVFVVREYIAPLSSAERVVLAAALLCSLTSAVGVQRRLAETYGGIFGWAGAIGLELIYVGTTLAGAVGGGRASRVLLGLSALAAGIAVVLNIAQHQAVGQVAWYSYVEAATFPLLAVGCSLLSHHISAATHARLVQAAALAREAAEREAEVRARAERERVEREEQERRWRERQQEERAFALARIQAEAQAEAVKIRARAASRAASRDSADAPVTARPAASGRGKTVDRDAVLPALRDALAADPGFSRAAFAKEHGISRPLVYKLLEELRRVVPLE